ncbi:MAG: hypothetical protein JWO89_1926 [Verrucomicrobiaceae bacterium]|nr:hypothetical protein [Verrucomicrobiaceae bacterium]
MIGEDYFELRSKLGTDLYVLAGLVHDLGGSGDDVHILENLISSLNDPFVFVVVGEVNVGKSTFLNALFGADFSRTGVMPTTDKIYFFKYGPEIQTTTIAPTVEEVRVPCGFLKDFHIVDTPGTNSIENEHQQITERFVPMADLVVFVFSAMNPWGASAWQFLEKVHRHWMRNVIFVLQQCDLRTPEEIQVITDYMGQLSRQRFNRDFPLFAVSAKKAYLARSSGLDREQLLADSGFQFLEDHISHTVTQSPTRLAKLGSALRLATQVLNQLTQRTTSRLATVRERRQLIDEMQAEREVQVQRTQTKFNAALDATDRDYREAAMQVVALAHSNFSVRAAFAAVKEDNRLPQNLDLRLFQDMLARSGERWQQVAAILEDDFKRFEDYISHHWRGELHLSELKNEEGEDVSVETRRRFFSRFETALRRFVLGLKIQETLEPGLILSRERARRMPWLAVMLPITAAVGAQFGWIYGLATLGFGFFLLLVLLFTLKAGLRHTLEALAGQFDEARETLRSIMQEHAREETENAFSVFSRILEPARDGLEQEEEAKRSISTRLQDVQMSFQKLAGQLHGHVPPV